jgi:hypothetical protein
VVSIFSRKIFFLAADFSLARNYPTHLALFLAADIRGITLPSDSSTVKSFCCRQNGDCR